MDVRTGFDHLSDEARPAFRVGDTLVEPSTRELIGPVGRVSLEPRVMRVLLTLADARGGVVTRDALLRDCWDGQFVGDDALNRAVAQVRKAAREVDSDGFGIETIAKTGYRLSGEIVAAVPSTLDKAAQQSKGMSRRRMIGGGATMLALAGGVGAFQWQVNGRRDRAATLLAQGRAELDDGSWGSDERALGLLTEAVVIDPRSAAAWGTLSLTWHSIACSAEPANAAAAVANVKAAAAKALALDNRQGEALTALATLTPMFGDWLATEQRLRHVLAIAPNSVDAKLAMWRLKMSTGQPREALDIIRRVAARQSPLASHAEREIGSLLGAGHARAADMASAKAAERWPKDDDLAFARMWVLTSTARPAAALAVVNRLQQRQTARSHLLEMLASSLHALHTRRPGDVDTAIAANIDWAKHGGMFHMSFLMLSAIGAIDAAFAVAQGILINQGPLRPTMLTGSTRWFDSWRVATAISLFMPLAAALRADARFLPMCEAVGLADYWMGSGDRPDFLGNRPLPV